jgi:quinol monooxygenase YgiN
MIILLSTAPLDPDSRDEWMEIVTWMARKSRAEPGVIDYRVTTDIEAPNTVRIIEKYADADAVDAHESSAHLEEFQRDIEPHLIGEPKLYRHDISERTEMRGP